MPLNYTLQNGKFYVYFTTHTDFCLKKKKKRYMQKALTWKDLQAILWEEKPSYRILLTLKQTPDSMCLSLPMCLWMYICIHTHPSTHFQVHLRKYRARRDKTFCVIWMVWAPQVDVFPIFHAWSFTTLKHTMSILTTPLHFVAHKMCQMMLRV